MPRRILEGTVVSDAQEKTIVVRVERYVKDALYGKFVRKSNKFSAHDEKNAYKVGDIVQIEECRPISKNKSWTVIGGGDAKAEKKAPAKKAAAKKETDAKAEKKTTKKKEAKA